MSKYACQDGAGWHLEIVDGAGDGGWVTSLALDESGYAHISYYDDDNLDLKYAYQDSAGWHLETVSESGGDYNSLALDESGNPHISFFNEWALSLEYAYQVGAEQNLVYLPLVLRNGP